MKKIRWSVYAFVLTMIFNPAVSAQDETPKVYEEHGIIAERGGNLIDKGQLIVEPGFQYTHIESQFVDITGFTVLPALVVGIIQSEEIRRDTWIPSLTFRYGLLDTLELNLRIPYSFREDSFTSGVAGNRIGETVSDSGVGDIEGSGFYQFWREKGARPALLGFLRIKSDTGADPFGIPTETIVLPSGQQSVSLTVPAGDLPHGSGFWAVEPGFTLVKSSDPAALFLNVGYFWHIQDDKGDFGEVDPSDSLNFTLGMAFALNEKLVLSTAYEQKFFNTTTIAGEKLLGTDLNIASILLGGSYILSEKTSFSLSVGFGLTPDSPDVQVSIRIPIKIF